MTDPMPARLPPTDPHSLPAEACLAALEATPQGLTAAEAARRLAVHGPNRLPEARSRGPVRRFLGQFNNVLINVLIGAAVVTAALQHWIDTAVILTVVLANAVIGFVQEGKAETAMAAIRGMLAPRAAVLRDGRRVSVDGTTLVPGDIVLLEAGDKVPADLRLVEARGLAAQEAMLTGESVPVDKDAAPVAPGAALGDRRSMLWSGTLVTQGTARGVVVATGRATEIGRIGGLLAGVEQLTTPLVSQMDHFGRWLSFLILLVSALLLVWTYFVAHRDFADTFMVVVAVAVSAIPEGLPAVMTITLAIGVQAMARRHAIVRRLPAIEAIGSVSVICTDKTGTLTNGRAEVTRVVALDGDEAGFLSLLAGLEAGSEHHIAAAIAREAGARGLQVAKVVDATARPGFGILGRDEDGPLWAGNPYLAEEMGARIDRHELRALADTAQTVVYLGRGQRVLGAVCVADEARPSSAAALAALRRGGVRRIVMMTGDRRPVALRIGGELGLAPDEIHAGMLPEDKVRQIADLTRDGKVAFVGDGVNDAAALARADVGIAMGAAGSEVALQAADVALLSEDMERLADAHRLSRRASAVIRQNLVFAIGAMLVLVTGGLFFDLPLPLAVIGHEGGTVLVVLNGLRLLSDPIRRPKPRAEPTAAPVISPRAATTTQYSGDDPTRPEPVRETG